MAPWLAADAMPTRFSAGFSTSATLRNVDVPVTTTSALNDSVNMASTATARPLAMDAVRRSTLKLRSRKVSSDVPAGTRSKRYAPASSLTAVSSVAPATSSMLTPGSTAPV